MSPAVDAAAIDAFVLFAVFEEEERDCEGGKRDMAHAETWGNESQMKGKEGRGGKEASTRERVGCDSKR